MVTEKSSFDLSTVPQPNTVFSTSGGRSKASTAAQKQRVSSGQGYTIFLTMLALVFVVVCVGVTAMVYPRITHLEASPPTPPVPHPSPPAFHPEKQDFQAENNEKNMQLKDFNPCGDFISSFREMGFNNLEPKPVSKDTPSGSPIRPGSHTIIKYVHSCFWTDSNFEHPEYVTIQNTVYSGKIPRISALEASIAGNWDPGDPPPASDFVNPIVSVRYAFNGYVGYISTGHDNLAGKRVCYVSVDPYVAIGATSVPCLKVVKLAESIFPR